MSCVWQETAAKQWHALPLPPGKVLTGPELGAEGVQLVALTQGGERGAILMVRPGLWARVNGQPVLGGLRVLEHRDEVLVGDARLFFSLETTPTVVVFQAPAGTRPPTCPVCRGPIVDGSQAVQCPGCGRWFHQADAVDGRPAKPCWTYAPTCRFCAHPTPFSAEAAWSPDREETHA